MNESDQPGRLKTWEEMSTESRVHILKIELDHWKALCKRLYSQMEQLKHHRHIESGLPVIELPTLDFVETNREIRFP